MLDCDVDQRMLIALVLLDQTYIHIVLMSQYVLMMCTIVVLSVGIHSRA